MSLENSITELAAAIRMLAEGIAGATRSNAHGQIAAALGEASLAVVEVTKSTGVQPDVTLGEVISGLRGGPGTEKKAKKEAQLDAELEQAVQKVEADSGKSDAGAAAQTQPADTAGSAKESAGTDQAALDYEKDVKPVLIKLAGAKGKAEMTTLVQSFGVAKATELKGDQLVQIVAKANELMAA